MSLRVFEFNPWGTWRLPPHRIMRADHLPPVFRFISGPQTVPTLMRNNRHPIQLHFQEDGTFLLRDGAGIPERTFPSLLDALNFAHSLSPHSDTRLTVFDANGKEIIETFV